MTVKQVEKFLKKVEEKTNIKFTITENGGSAKKYGYVIEGEYWSDLGEDVIITLVIDEADIEEVVHAMYECEEGFDPEEHAAELFNLHGKHGTPTSLRALLKDADKQAEKLEQIYDVMRELPY